MIAIDVFIQSLIPAAIINPKSQTFTETVEVSKIQNGLIPQKLIFNNE